MRLRLVPRHLHRDEEGFVTLFAAFAITAIVFVSGIAVDMARYYMARDRINSNVSLAALAGAVAYNPTIDSMSVVSDAVNQSLTSNDAPGLMTTQAATVTFRCSAAVQNNTNSVVVAKNSITSCSNINKANIVKVQQTATVTLAFGSILHVNSLVVSATSEAIPAALPPGSISSDSKPLNIGLIVDTTASMNDTDGNCTDSSGKSLTRLDCVKMGLAYLLNMLAGTNTQIQLLTFPPLASTSNAGYEVCNPSGSPKITSKYGNYTVSPQTPYGSSNEIYSILPKVAAGGAPTATNTNDASFKLALDNGGYVLNPSSDWYKLLGPFACGGGKSNCTNACTGLKAVGGVGTYYGDAFAWARNNLTITNDGTRQDVIVLLSDGDASATAMPTTTAKFGTISSVVTGLTLNGVNATDRGTKINSTLETPGTNAFPQTSGTCKSGSVFCGKTNNTYITKSGSTYKDQCKAAAQYADQLAEYLPKAINGASIAEPKIFSFYYGSGTTGCSTDTDKAYTPCYTMQKIASDISNFYSVDSGCVLSRGNAQVKDISVAFGDMLRTILGGAGFKPRLVPAGF